ncbi:DUF6163 family protein [uncultured Methylobacterium sp.]|uniref:DUF6163 family protein n=1 Tax=uncultured Methylobacterium sp. TaxID=157278 RepID=UPI0035CB4761
MRGPGRGARGGGVGEGASDRIERSAGAPKTTWDTVLVWFMRLTALAWLAKSVASWATILDVIPGLHPFAIEPFGRQATLVYFAVIDATAAIGLWLTSAWGGVVWLLAVTSMLTLAVLTPQLLQTHPVVVLAEVGVVIIYFILSWRAAQEAR